MKNIKSLPIESLVHTYKEILDPQLAEMLETREKIERLKYERKVSTFMKEVGSGETDEGLEESIRETIGPMPEAEIPEDVLKELKDTVRTQVVEEFCNEYSISSNLSWFPFQLINYFSNWKPVAGEDGKLSGTATVRANIKDDDFALGMLFLATGPRTPFFKGAPTIYRQYSSPIGPLVPIILAGFKQGMDIGYNKWGRDTLQTIVDQPLLDAMLSKYPEITKEELREIQRECLTDKTGARKKHPANTSTKLNGLQSTPLIELPKLARYMILQTWVAHPSNRNALGVYDPSNWDATPENLVAMDLLQPAPVKLFSAIAKKPKYTSDLPF